MLGMVSIAFRFQCYSRTRLRFRVKHLLAVRVSGLGCSIKSSVLGLGFAARGGARGSR